MSKNTPQELRDEGFAPEQFGKDASTWDGFAQPILDEANQTVQERTGTQYGSTDANIANHIKRAERFFAVAELWDIRASRVDAESSVGQDHNPAESRHFARNAERALSKANYELSLIPSAAAAASAPAFGVETSTHFGNPASSRNSLAGLGGVL